MADAHTGTRHRSVSDHADAIAAMLEPLTALPAEKISLRDALGRLSADDMHSPLDLPIFRNSQMDGFATTAAAISQVPQTLPIAATVAAGDAPPAPLHPGTAVRIMTGAPIPDGADCIVPVEDTEVDGDRVRIDRSRAPGEYIREPGTDVRSGAFLLPAGTTLAPRHIALLAAVGIGSMCVRRRPRVAVITTGAELVAAGQALSPGQIYDSNGIALASSVQANGAELVSVTRSSDDPAQFRELLTAATATADLVVTSGGVSMGDFEVVKETLSALGGEFGHIAMQPGGPQGLSLFDGVPVLSFPGNPVSTLVSFEVFLRPLLRRAAGLPPLPDAALPIAHYQKSVPDKRQFLRGRRVGAGVEVVSGPGSHLVAAMAWADVLIDIPADMMSVDAGTDVRVWQL